MSERTPRRPPGGAGRDRGDRATGGRATGGRAAGERAAGGRAGGGRATGGRADGGLAGGGRAGGAKGAQRAVAGASGDAPPRIRPGDPGRWPVEERSLVPSVLGVPPLAAVGVAAGLTALGVTVDLLRIGTLGAVFTICYLTGCVLGVAWVRRDALFWPMVVPPLLMAVAVPVVVLLTGTAKPGAGIAERLLVIGAPLVNGFPMMAWTTGLTLVVGVLRLVTQRLRRGPAAARGEGRTSGSPRRS